MCDSEGLGFAIRKVWGLRLGGFGVCDWEGLGLGGFGNCFSDFCLVSSLWTFIFQSQLDWFPSFGSLLKIVHSQATASDLFKL